MRPGRCLLVMLLPFLSAATPLLAAGRHAPKDAATQQSWHFVQNGSAADRRSLARAAAKQTFDVHASGGMAKLEANSRSCYEGRSAKHLCFYLDIAAMQIDCHETQRLGAEPNQYFDDVYGLFDRIGAALYPGVDLEEGMQLDPDLFEGDDALYVFLKRGDRALRKEMRRQFPELTFPDECEFE